MSAIVERKDGSLVMVIHMTLKIGRDDALIRLIRAAPRHGLATIVREAMRSGTPEKEEEVFADDNSHFELPDIGVDL